MQIVDFNAPNAAKAFTSSLKETGFGVLSGHPIASDRLAALYREWQAFFDGEDKFDFLYDESTQDGYYPVNISETAKGHDIRDIKEFYHIYPHGRIPAALRDSALSYYRDVSEFAATLLGWLESQSPPEVAVRYSEPLSDMIRNTQHTLLRVLHYPPMSGGETPGAVRAAAHEDINLLTILPAASAPGLQVLTKSGEWLDVPCEWGNLIVNIGDMLQEASGGYFPSTTHRVVNPTDVEQNCSRISLPLFLHPRSDVVLSDRYTAQSYLDERLRELGIKT